MYINRATDMYSCIVFLSMPLLSHSEIFDELVHSFIPVNIGES